MTSSVENKVKEYEEKYGLLTQGLVDSVWVVELDTLKYLYTSSNVERLRGYTAEEIIDSPIHEHMTPASYKKAIKALVEEVERFKGGEGRSVTLELEFYRKDGSALWLEITARLYQEKDGSIRILGISKDIDERKRFERKQQQLIRELEVANAEKERLLKENKLLTGLLPICTRCKKIKDDGGQWWEIENFISERTDAEFSHSICPECEAEPGPE